VADRRRRLAAIERLRKAAKKSGCLGGGADLVMFGSQYTGLSLFDSDLDLAVVNFPDFRFYTKEQKLACMKKLANFLIDQKICDNPSNQPQIRIIDTARVPLVECSIGGIQIDVGFGSFADGRMALKSSDWINAQIEKFPFIRFLVLFLKVYLKVRGLNDVFHGGVGSFLLNVLVVVFIKNHGSAASSRIYAQTNLGHLLFDFFKFYAFDLNEAKIAILSNGEFEPICRPDDTLSDQMKLSVILCDQGYKDIGSGVWLWPQVKRAFRNSYLALCALSVNWSAACGRADEVLTMNELLGKETVTWASSRQNHVLASDSTAGPAQRSGGRRGGNEEGVIDLVSDYEAVGRPGAIVRPKNGSKEFVEITDSEDEVFRESRRKRFRHH
jgi:non-canonical poly(A) RNA polymerase PAPD5/7